MYGLELCVSTVEYIVSPYILSLSLSLSLSLHSDQLHAVLSQ